MMLPLHAVWSPKLSKCGLLEGAMDGCSLTSSLGDCQTCTWAARPSSICFANINLADHMCLHSDKGVLLASPTGSVPAACMHNWLRKNQLFFVQSVHCAYLKQILLRSS